MDVSDRDRAALARQQRDLALGEQLDEERGAARDAAVAAANDWRSRHGIAPLRDEADRPEKGLHELACARGLSDRAG